MIAVREHLRRLLDVGTEMAGSNTPRDTDEDILNVFRRELQAADGGEELTTSEVAEYLSIESPQTNNRLNQLENENRVEKRKAGRTDMWSLGRGESETLVNPDLGAVVSVSASARRTAQNAKNTAIKLCGLGFGLLLLGMTALISTPNPTAFTAPYFLAFGYSCGIVGAIIGMGSIMLEFAANIAPHLTERFLLE